MAEPLTNLSCTEFAAVLAAKQSVPGGGGAAALVGALGAALSRAQFRSEARTVRARESATAYHQCV